MKALAVLTLTLVAGLVLALVIVPVEAGFRQTAKEAVYIAPLRPLDPVPTLQWHTFMGGSSNEWGTDAAVDKSGNPYVVGFSYTTWGSPVSGFVGGKDAFVAKLDSTGSRQWNTFLGSTGEDGGNGIAVDGNGNVYIVGTSDQTWGSPINAHARADWPDAFVVKLNSSGALQWMTFLGGLAADTGSGIALDGNGNIYVVGTAGGSWGSPVAPYPSDAWYAPFVAKLNSSGGVQWHTYWGAGGLDSGNGIAIDGSGSVYVVGDCYNTWGSPVDPYTGGTEACAAKLGTDGVLQWNTFLGSANSDSGSGIAMDGSGNAYVVGSSVESWGTPIAPHDIGSNFDIFVAKLGGSDGARQWHTFMGTSDVDSGNDVTVDKAGEVYVTGNAKDTWSARVNEQAGVFHDAFVTQLAPDGTRGWSVFLGGVYNHDYGDAVVVDGRGHAYVVGHSTDSWGAPVDDYSGGLSDALAIRLDLPVEVDLTIRKSVEPSVAEPGEAITYQLAFSNMGYLTATDVLITDTVPIALTGISYTASGPVITPTGSISYSWQVGDLLPGMGGLIQVTGVVSPSLQGGVVLVNTAYITSTTADGDLEDNSSSARVLIPSSHLFLPSIVRNY